MEREVEGSDEAEQRGKSNQGRITKVYHRDGFYTEKLVTERDGRTDSRGQPVNSVFTFTKQGSVSPASKEKWS